MLSSRLDSKMKSHYFHSVDLEVRPFCFFRRPHVVNESDYGSYCFVYNSIPGSVFSRKCNSVRGVLGNKCAGQHNLKTLHFKETVVLDNF
jgi:hypothetical protein